MSGCSTRTRSRPSSACQTATSLGGGYGQEFDADLASLEKIGAGDSDPGFVEELAELEVPEEDPAPEQK